MYDSLFMLADNWCTSIEDKEYEEFFSQLKYKIKYGGQGNAEAYDVLT